MLSVQDNDQMLKNVVHIYPEDRTKDTLANLISATEILCSLSQIIVREDFHTMYIWTTKQEHVRMENCTNVKWM